MFINKLILGDNLDVMQTMESESVDLIYLDPPFFSNRNYEVIWGDDGEIRSFQDRWAGGIEHYIAWLKERVIEMHRLLKPTGSIFLHCDWHANAYIRVHILDRIFGENNFRNEIVWDYEGWVHKKMSHFPQKHDIIFYYSKSDKSTYIPLSEKWTKEEYIAKRKQKIHIDDDGREYIYDKRGASGQKRYLDTALSDGQPITDVWHISVLTSSSKERIGYPTQKPEALLERIIKCASNEGDIVLDPFVGGGTTVAVADKLRRRWIGIDQSVAAIKVSDLRLKKLYGIFERTYELQLRKYDYDELRGKDAFAFEVWIIEKYGGIANQKQRSDFGLDGRKPDNTPIQVKRSDNIGRNVIDNFLSAVQRSDENLFKKNQAEGKPVGYIIAFSFSKGAIEETARLKNKNIIIELVKVSDIVPYGKKPIVSVSANETEEHFKYVFEAAAESEVGIEFYSWDFSYDHDEGFKADEYLDKAGKQVRKFQPGEYLIAAQAIDKDGLDGMDTVAIKVKQEE